MTADPAGSLARHRLGQLIYALIIATGALIALNGVAVYLRPTVWVFAMLAILLLEPLGFVIALRLAERGALERSVATLSIMIWAGAIAASWVSPLTLPVHEMAALIPAICAAPYVPRRQLPRYFLGTLVCVSVAAALALPRLTSSTTPIAVRYLAALAYPAVAAPMLVVVWHTAATMREIAIIARRAADALRSSQRLLAERADQLTASRARLVAATDAERRRLEQDLHDGAQQQLVAVAVTLQLARQTAVADPGGCAELIGEAGELLQSAIADIRRLAQGIYPPLLARDGLSGALPAAATRSPVPARVRTDRLGRYQPDIETALYYCCLEALQNSAKHGGPGTTVTIVAQQRSGTLLLTISDTGRGFDPAPAGPGLGLTNMHDRLSVIGGTLTVDSAPGMGTRLTASVPTRPLPSLRVPASESR